MKKFFRDKTWIGFAFAILLLVALAVSLSSGQRTPAAKKDTPVASPAEVADIIIEKEKKDAAAKTPDTPVATTQTPPKDPVVSDKVFYLTGNVDLAQANFQKEGKISSLYGGERSIFVQSAISFEKNVYKGQEVRDSIQLVVFLKPTNDRDDKNYIEFIFALQPPSANEERWGATVEFFASKTQGSTRFPLAYDIFIERWQKEEIINLASQILDIVFAK